MQRRTAGTGAVLVTILLDAIGVGLIFPVLPSLVEGFLGTGPAGASRPMGLLMSAYALMLFLCAPALGALSDRLGRRPVILVTLAGATIDYALMALAPALWVLFLGRVLAGACGANHATAAAYIADVTPPEKRARSFGLIGAAFGLGFILGPALGGLLGAFGPRVPFWVAGGLTLLNLLYALFVLPESLPVERRRPFSWASANPLCSLARLRAFPGVIGLAAVFIAVQLAGQVPPAVWPLFTEHRFAWTPRDIGVSLAVVGICMATAQGLLTGRVIGLLGERRALLVGLVLCIAAFLLFGSAGGGWMMYPITALYSLGCITGPAAQAMMSHRAPADRQGELQGSLTSLISVVAVVGPIFAAEAFAWGAAPGMPPLFDGAPWFAGAAVFALALALAPLALRRSAP